MPTLLEKAWFQLPARVRAVARAWKNPPQRPISVQIEQTSRCNLKCVMCSHSYDPPDKVPDLDLERYKRLVDELAGVKVLHLQGLGEPMLYKNIIEMIDYAQERGIQTRFISNMTVMTDELAEALVRSGHNEICVSIESTSAEVFANIRRGVKFDVLERVLRNIGKLNEAKKRLGSTTPNIEVFSILMKHTIPLLPHFVATLRDIGVHRICFQELITGGLPDDITVPGGNNLMNETLNDMSDEELAEVVATIRGLSSESFEVKLPPRLESIDGFWVKPVGIRTCSDLWERPAIRVEGDVAPCCYEIRNPAMSMGNINEQSFDEIWYGDKFQKLRYQHLTNQHPKACANCYQLISVLEYPRNHPGPFPDGQQYKNVFVGKEPYSAKGNSSKSRS